LVSNCSDDSSIRLHTKKSKATSVEIKVVESENFVDYIQVVGTVKPIKSAKLSYSESGTIKTFYKKKGSKVYKGSVICVIDNDVLKSSLEAGKGTI